MKTAVDRINPTRVKLRIEVTPAEFKPAIDKAYRQIANQVNVPGFRKGKIPAAIIDQRVGRQAVLAQAVDFGLDAFYKASLDQNNLRPLGQPQADVKQLPNEHTLLGDLVVEIEVEVRPEIQLPNYRGIKIEVDTIKVAGKEIEEELDSLRARFGTLITVERPAKKGDFVSIDLKAEIEGKEIDAAENVSYEVGSGNLLDGIDDAIENLTAGETSVFRSKLVGGEMAGSEAEVTLTVRAVKERELPKADDAFAQMSSQFDTLEDLKRDIESQITKTKRLTQAAQARELITDELLRLVEIPVSKELIESDVNRHLEGEGRLNDEKHRKEVTEESEKSFKVQMLLDSIVEIEGVKVNEQELMQYLVMSSRQYGLDPNEFIETLGKNGQISLFVAEAARRKALNIAVASAIVTDKAGKTVDLSQATNGLAENSSSHEGHHHE